MKCCTGTSRHVEQRSKTEDPNMSTPNFCHLKFDKDAQKLKLERRKHLEPMVLGKLDVHMQNTELDLYLSPYTKTNLK